MRMAKPLAECHQYFFFIYDRFATISFFKCLLQICFAKMSHGNAKYVHLYDYVFLFFFLSPLLFVLLSSSSSTQSSSPSLPTCHHSCLLFFLSHLLSLRSFPSLLSLQLPQLKNHCFLLSPLSPKIIAAKVEKFCEDFFFQINAKRVLLIARIIM